MHSIKCLLGLHSKMAVRWSNQPHYDQCIYCNKRWYLKDVKGWVLPETAVNSIQTVSIKELIRKSKHAHFVDVRLRINGQYVWVEADWIKHLVENFSSPNQANQP
jgi:hypothetical protein